MAQTFSAEYGGLYDKLYKAAKKAESADKGSSLLMLYAVISGDDVEDASICATADRDEERAKRLEELSNFCYGSCVHWRSHHLDNVLEAMADVDFLAKGVLSKTRKPVKLSSLSAPRPLIPSHPTLRASRLFMAGICIGQAL